MMKIFIILLIMSLFLFYEVNSRGGGRGGGSRGGSSRSGGYRSGYRSSGGSTSYRSASQVFSSRTALTAGLVGGSIYLGRSWRSRYGHNSFDKYISFEVCYNDVDSIPDDDLNSTDIFNNSNFNNSIFNNSTDNSTDGSILGYFICPLDNNTSAKYCCGSEDMEYCCGYIANQWENIYNGVIWWVIFMVFGFAVYTLARRFICKRQPLQNPVNQEEAQPLPPPPPNANMNQQYYMLGTEPSPMPMPPQPMQMPQMNMQMPPPMPMPPPNSEYIPMIDPNNDLPPPAYQEPEYKEGPIV